MGTQPQPPAPVDELAKRRLARPERLFHEINLLYLEGHYFTFDPKAANVFLDPMKSVEKRLLNPKINEEQPIEVVPHPGYGKPSVFAYKVYQAILKKLSDYGHPVPEGVSFGHRELMRLVGRTSTGGKNSKELVRVLNQFRNTGINCWFYDKHTKTSGNLSFSLASRFLYTYKGRGSISLVTLWLDPLLIKSINNHYTFCLNLARMENLEPISLALYKHLYFHFSNIYSTKRSEDFTFRKNYAEICHAWLGGLKVLRYKAKIKQEQLGKHLEALKQTRLIKSYEIEKNAEGDGFNLVFRPGRGFFEDYEHFYRRRMQAELPFTLAVDEHTIQKPQEIVQYFYEKLYGTNEVDELGFSEKETSFAASLLEKHTVADMRRFIDYGLAEASKTNFDIKTLGGLKKYYLPYTKHLAAQARTRALGVEEDEKRANERHLSAYDSYRHGEVAKIRSVLSPAEIKAIETGIREELEAQHSGAKIFSGWIQRRADRAIAEKHGVLSFEEWQKRGG
jgi:DNA-binding XRE family transcriptional regulator